MKININGDNNMTIYIKDTSIDFSNETKLDDYFTKLIKKLRKVYNIYLKGFYDIKVYKDNYYGIILDLTKEESDYYELLDHIDMQFSFHKYLSFLYQVDDIIDFGFNNKMNIYFYKNKFYIELTDSVDFVLLGRLIEHSKIIYDDLDLIINKAKIIEF